MVKRLHYCLTIWPLKDLNINLSISVPVGVFPTIILQSDHGPRNSYIDGRYPTDDMFKEGMRILNAYYMPSNGSDFLYDSITPVNTFRVIFNTYFGTDYELLEDKSYNSFDFSPYKFTDITDMVDYD